jgi:hypothetical protein
MAEVTLQNLSDCGLNPLAVKLLVESWKKHPNPKPVRFVFAGVLITLEAAPKEKKPGKPWIPPEDERGTAFLLDQL